MENKKSDPLYDLLLSKKSEFQRIAHKSKGQHNTDDALNTAYLIAVSWNPPFDIENPEHFKQLCGWVYNELIGYAEKNIAYGISIDQTSQDNESNERLSSVYNQLVANTHDEPLEALLISEIHDEESLKPDRLLLFGYSKIVGYMLLLRKFHNSHKELAASLMISTSWLYRCIQRATKLYTRQLSLFDEECAQLPALAQLKTWRTFKIQRVNKKPPLQLDDQTRWLFH